MSNDEIVDCIKLVGQVYVVGVVVEGSVGVVGGVKFGEDVYNLVCVVCYVVGVLGVFKF